MKFALNAAALAVAAAVSLWTPPVQSLGTYKAHKNFGELILSVTANDEVWAKYLNVGIKVEPKKLSAAAHKVLVGLKVLDAWPKTGGSPGKAAQTSEERGGGGGGGGGDVVVARALHIVTDVSSHYSKQGVAVDFARTAMVSAIKCNALMYVLMQLHAIEKTNELQNEAITYQPTEVWNTMVRVLDKVTVLKESIEMEFDLYQRWEVVANHDMTKKLPPQFEDFKSMVASTLDATCELNTFDEIFQHMDFDSESENLNTATGAMQIFNKCQKFLTAMFNDIPISAMKLEVWENFLNKPKLAKSDD